MIVFNSLIRIRGHSMWVAELKAGDVIVDAGAHRGEFATEAHQRFGCRCILVEANPMLAAQLQPPPGGQVFSAGLAATDGSVNFVFRENLEGGGIVAKDGDENKKTTAIDTVSLATLCQRALVNHIALLKLDIEGAEFPLLEKTPDSLLVNIGQITVEFHDFLPEFGGRGLFEAARDRLEKLGFICCPMAFRTHGDVLFLNRRLVKLSGFALWWIKHCGRFVLKLQEWRLARNVRAPAHAP